MKNSFFTIALMLFTALAATAQDFRLFYANNVSDVSNFTLITESNSGLVWREVMDTDIDGNQAEVYRIEQMLASQSMKGLEEQQQFWRMRDHSLLCFRIEDAHPSTPDTYEVVVEETVSGKAQSLTVTNYFFVNVPLEYTPRTEYAITVTKVGDPSQRIRFKYNVYDWNNENLYIFQLDRKRQITDKDYTMEYVTGYMDENGFMQTDTTELQLKSKSFQSFYLPEGRDLLDVILVGDENKLRINKNRLHTGIDLEDRYTRMRLTPNFILDKHQDREFINFNWLGSGLFEKYDTLYISLWNHRSQSVSSATFHVEQVDDRGRPTHSKVVKYVGYDRKTGMHKVLTMGKPAYIEILTSGYYPTIYKYAGAADEETGFVSEERCTANLTLRSGRWNRDDLVISSHHFLNLHDERAIVVRNGVDHRLCTIEEMELTGRTAVDTITYLEDCGHPFPKLLDNKTIDRYAKMEITFSIPKGGVTPVSRLTCTEVDSKQMRETTQDEVIVVSANDFTSFSRDYYFVRYDLLNAIHKGDVVRMNLTAGDLSYDQFPLLCNSDYNRDVARSMADQYAFDNCTGAPPRSSSSRGQWQSTWFSELWKKSSSTRRSLFKDPQWGDNVQDDGMGDAFADFGCDIKLPVQFKFNIRPVTIYTGVSYDILKQILALKVNVDVNRADDRPGDDYSDARKELKENEKEDYWGGDKVGVNVAGEDVDPDRWINEDINDIFEINSNHVGAGFFGGGTLTLQTPIKDWSKFQVTEAAGYIGYGFGMAWDLFGDDTKFEKLKDVMEKAKKFISLSISGSFEANVQADFGIHSFDGDIEESMSNLNMGYFFQLGAKAKIGATAEFGLPEWTKKAAPILSVKAGVRAGAKVGGFFKVDGPFAPITPGIGGRLMAVIVGQAYFSAKLFCLHASGNAGIRLGGQLLIPDNDHNPFHSDFPYWLHDADVRTFGKNFRKLPAPEPTEFGRVLVSDVAIDANPHFLGGSTIVYNNVGQPTDYNDDQVTLLNMETMQKETLSKEGMAAANHMRSKRGDHEVVVFEQYNKRVDSEAVDSTNNVRINMDAMTTTGIRAAFREGNGQWKTTSVTDEGEYDGYVDISPVVSIQDNGSAACIYQHGRYSLINNKGSDNDLENYLFNGQLMLRTYDGSEWSKPTALFDIDDTHNIGKYDLVMRGDTALVATLVSTADNKRPVLRYASKPMNSTQVTYRDEELRVDDFFMKRVGKNSVIAMTYEATDSIRDIYVKTLDMDGTNDGRMGSDIGLDFCQPSKVKIVCDRSATNLDDFAVLWTEVNNTRRREDGTTAIDSMRTVLNASRIHLANAPQVTAPITVGSEIDTLLVMTDFDGFLDDDSISVVYTLADPESGAGMIMRSGKVFTNSFEHEVSYTNTALRSSSELPVNILIRNTGTSAIEKVEATINGQVFDIEDSYVAPLHTRTFTVQYPIDDTFDGYITSHVDVIYNNIFKARTSRRRGAPSNVRQRSPQKTSRVSMGEVDCVVVNHSIEDGVNTFVVELTDYGKLRSDMGVRVGVYPHPNGGIAITEGAEVVVPATEFTRLADERRAYATVVVSGITEPIQAYINVRVMEPAPAGDEWKLVPTPIAVHNASLVNLYPTDEPTEIRRPDPVKAGNGDDSHRVAIDTQEGGITLRNLVPGERVRIFNADGRAVFYKTTNGTSLFVPMHQTGVYVLSAGEEVFKFQY